MNHYSKIWHVHRRSMGVGDCNKGRRGSNECHCVVGNDNLNVVSNMKQYHDSLEEVEEEPHGSVDTVELAAEAD